MTDQPLDSPSVLITGGYGCIGAETAKWLIRHTDSDVVVCSRRVSKDRTQRVFGEIDSSRMTFVQADVCDQGRLQAILREHRISRVTHMAGLQTPDCNAHRDLGLQINLGGTQNLIEAMKANGLPIKRFVFASSLAVYGPRSDYPSGRVPMLAQPQPVNVYGAWKLAGEQISRFFSQDTGTATISVRPGVLFGPGRDAGLTAAPTTAMKHVALGTPYEISFRNRQDYLYAADVGAAVGHALLEPFEGYAAFTLPSQTVDTAVMVDAIRRAADELQIADPFQITIGSEEVPFVCDLEYQPFLDAFPKVPQTTLHQAVRQSIQTFLDQAGRGELSQASL